MKDTMKNVKLNDCSPNVLETRSITLKNIIWMKNEMENLFENKDETNVMLGKRG